MLNEALSQSEVVEAVGWKHPQFLILSEPSYMYWVHELTPNQENPHWAPQVAHWTKVHQPPQEQVGTQPTADAGM
ncbi:hypothetical protein SKAU_G00237840 [Synaphobranchus kaupii]|uniref:Uncharacterized protein n=1 Tax=Synaphobranchus kaupii TaxID=118154 RepID=A0A9Q1F722_SYNKA|nr:hypothetical protein SKAU_G00237840 [Synaphobranchus kaupii]